MTLHTKLPNMLYGTAWKKERTAQYVVQAIKAGFVAVDTASAPEFYREELVGEAVQTVFDEGIAKRDDLFIQTKFTKAEYLDRSLPLPYDPEASIPEQVKQSFQTSLRQLQVDWVDSVLLHTPMDSNEDTLLAYRALESLVDQGKIRHLGVSNFFDPVPLRWLIERAIIKVEFVQNKWYQGNAWDWKVYDVCQEHDIVYQPFWMLKESPKLLENEGLVGLAAKHEMSPQQMVYKLCQLWDMVPYVGQPMSPT